MCEEVINNLHFFIDINQESELIIHMEIGHEANAHSNEIYSVSW